jgi:cell division protein FtsW
LVKFLSKSQPSRRPKRGRVLAGDTVRKIETHKMDFTMLSVVLGLSAFGLLMVYDASVAVAISRYDERFHFVYDQATSLGLGLVAMLAASAIDYQLWKRFSVPIIAIALVLLLAVFTPLGVDQGGALSWLDVGVVTFQPSYLLAVALIIFLANWLTRESAEPDSWSNHFLPFMVMMGGILAIVAIPQGDLGTALLIGSVGIIMYFMSGAPLKHLLLLLPIGAAAGSLLALIQPYRVGRLLTLLNGAEADTLGQGWQISQIMIALGSGGLTGLGLGQSRQKYEYIPVVESDSIFAVIGEELGFLGAVFLIGVLSYFIWRGFELARQTGDPFGRLIVIGVMSFIAIQALINLLGVTALIPFTGIPLPFISSGGTSLIVLLGAVGVVLNISKHRNMAA